MKRSSLRSRERQQLTSSYLIVCDRLGRDAIVKHSRRAARRAAAKLSRLCAIVEVFTGFGVDSRARTVLRWTFRNGVPA